MIFAILAVALFVVLAVAWVVSIYNRLIVLRNQVNNQWADIDVVLQQRHDLVPNLVATVSGYATHEKTTLEGVIAARGAAVSAGSNPAAVAGAEQQLTQALGRLMAVAEAYPDLKANQQFLALQDQLTKLEARIASERDAYNTVVTSYNNKIQVFPTNLVAGSLHFVARELFKTEDTDREVPQVQFPAA